MRNLDLFIGGNYKKELLNLSLYEEITISFDSGGSGGGAYFMGFVTELAKHPRLMNRLTLVTGVSAGGYAAFFLSTKRTKEAKAFWERVCAVGKVLQHMSMQGNIDAATKKLIGTDEITFSIPTKIFAKMMPSTRPNKKTPSLIDRFSSRLGFKCKEFVYWSLHISQHDARFCFNSKQYVHTKKFKIEKNITLRKVLVGGARFLPILMGPTIKIGAQEAEATKERYGGIIHGYGMITLLGGLENIVPLYKRKKTLHLVVVGQHGEEYFWNMLRRTKIQKLLSDSNNTVLLITPIRKLPLGYFGIPNWLSFSKRTLNTSYAIGTESAQVFLKRLRY